MKLEDYVILAITAAICYALAWYFNFRVWAIILAIAIFLFILWLLLDKAAEEAKKKAGKRIIGTYVGYMVTWMSAFSTYENVRGENAMRVVYGRADIYNDGYMESNPESFRMTYRMGATDVQIRFNPFYDMYILKDFARKQGGKEVPFVDGTEQYLNLNLFGVRSQFKQAPKNLTRLPRTQSV